VECQSLVSTRLLRTGYEGTDDLDGDGLPNYLDRDSDGDGFSDRLEDAFGSDPYDVGDWPAVPLVAWPLALALLVTGAALTRRLDRKVT